MPKKVKPNLAKTMEAIEMQVRDMAENTAKFEAGNKSAGARARKAAQETNIQAIKNA